LSSEDRRARVANNQDCTSPVTPGSSRSSLSNHGVFTPPAGGLTRFPAEIPSRPRWGAASPSDTTTSRTFQQLARPADSSPWLHGRISHQLDFASSILQTGILTLSFSSSPEEFGHAQTLVIRIAKIPRRDIPDFVRSVRRRSIVEQATGTRLRPSELEWKESLRIRQDLNAFTPDQDRPSLRCAHSTSIRPISESDGRAGNHHARV